MTKFFPLFKNNYDIEEGVNDEFINILKKCNNPHIICVYGDARLGKSTKLNQIINGVKSKNFFGLTGPFRTRLEIHTAQTKGIDFYGPIKVKDLVDRNNLDINEFDNDIRNDDLFFVDTEGLKSIDQVTKTCVAGILTILQIADIKILYMPILDNEKLEEAAKNSNLTNILNIFDNQSETIVLIRDVPLKDCKNLQQITEEIEEQKQQFQTKIDNYFEKINAKKAKCEILPNYELAKNNIDDFPEAYKQQIQSLIMTFLSNIKHRNIDGNMMIEIIKELIDIFKQVEDIESMRNTNNALNKILKTTFEQKVKKIYLEIQDKIKEYDKTIIKLGESKENIINYLKDCIQKVLKDSWNIYFDSLKNEIDNILEKYELKIINDIKTISSQIQDKINNEVKDIINIASNKDINDFFSKYKFSEEISEDDIKKLIDKIILAFLNKFKKEFECYDDKYKTDISEYIKENLEQNLEYRKDSMKKREVYLINEIEIIKREISNPFVSDLLKKSKKEIQDNLDLNVLKQKIQLYISKKNVIEADKEDFKKKLEELYQDIKKTLKERISSIENGELIKEFEKKLLYGRTLSDGIYFIKPIINQSKVVHIDNNNIVIWDNKNENKQKFMIKYDSFHSCYSIQNIENNQFFTCDNSIVFLSGKINNKNQQWHIINADDGYYEIILETNNYSMGIDNENANDGTKILCKEKNGKTNQKFNFEATSKTVPPPPPPPPQKQNPPPPPQPQVRYFPRPNWHYPYLNQCSIVDALKSIGVDSSQAYRKRIGDRNGIPGAPFSPAYNTHMLNLMKEGRLIIP